MCSILLPDLLSDVGDGKVRWITNSKGFRFDTGMGIVREIDLESLTGKFVGEDTLNYRATWVSPDGVFKRAYPFVENTIKLDNTLTNKAVNVKIGSAYGLIDWTPGGMLAFNKAEEKKISDGSWSGDFTSLWLAFPEDRKYNQMCLALECDKDEFGVILKPSWSSDASKVAYSSQGRAYTLDLGLRDLNLNEKAEAGLLSEDDEKEMLTDNAKQVGLAMNMYAADWDNTLPPANGFVDAVKPYMKDVSILNRPGTGKMAFQFLPYHSMSDIKDPATTVLGFFDVGYKWKVVIYADWHVAVIPKD